MFFIFTYKATHGILDIIINEKKKNAIRIASHLHDDYKKNSPVSGVAFLVVPDLSPSEYQKILKSGISDFKNRVTYQAGIY